MWILLSFENTPVPARDSDHAMEAWFERNLEHALLQPIEPGGKW
jgi:hypothetical protein